MRISGISRQCSDHERISTGAGSFECIAVPGHTSGSFAYYFPEYNALFTGDTLFYAGCGRVFGNDYATLNRSLMTIAAFPEATRVYCGHEYTLDNLAFARTIEPGNGAIGEREASVKQQLRCSLVYGPSTIALEKATNPFLRCNEPTVCNSAGLPAATLPEAVFAQLRRKKDIF
jgi:hydroxyacylglutathione hydrolase